jgi:hypothetical protein
LRIEGDRGQADAINRGFAAVPDAEIMGYLNADDILLPGTLHASAPRWPHFVHLIRGPNDGTGTSSGHASTVTSVW